MTKTIKELNQLKQECIDLNNKLKELSEEELIEIVGGENASQNDKKEIEFILIRGGTRVKIDNK